MDKDKLVEPCERMSEQEAVECLQLKLAAARSWLAKCDSEVAAFSVMVEGLRPLLEVWEGKQAGTTRQVAFYEALLAIYDDRNEWRIQHENLLSVRQSDLTTLEAARYRWQELCRRAMTYLKPTLGITNEIRAALPPYDEARAVDAAIDAAALRSHAPK